MNCNINSQSSNVLIVGCGNIAASHYQALYSLGFRNIMCFDFDVNRSNLFAMKFNINTWNGDLSVPFGVIVVAVQVEYRDDYYNLLEGLAVLPDILVVEKPVLDVKKAVHPWLYANRQAITTPYLRVLGIESPEIFVSEKRPLIVKENRKPLVGTDSFDAFVDDLLPHWLSVFVWLGASVDKLVQDDVISGQLKIHVISKGDIIGIIDVGISIDSLFRIIHDNNEIQSISINDITLGNVVRNYRYFYDFARGGLFRRYYKLVLSNDERFMRLNNELFDLYRNGKTVLEEVK